MGHSFVRSVARKIAPLAAAVTALASAAAAGPATASAVSLSITHPQLDWQLVAGVGVPPPTQAACIARNRRCFNPSSIQASYDITPLYGLSNQGFGKTIAVVDSFGSSTIRQDLANFNNGFGLPHLCGETGPSDPSANCSSSTQPRFDIVEIQGSPAPVPPPPSHGTGLEAHDLWSVEVSLDVEWAHAVAPMANIMLVTTPTAEVLGMQGFQQMMNAEDTLIKSHRVDVISQSFGAAEGTFNNGLAAINSLRHAYIDAVANHVTVFASSGDFGSANPMKVPVKNPGTIPYPSVGWPASDPLVTATGGTYLCTNAVSGVGVDNTSPPPECQQHPGDREPAWVPSGGGYSIVFPRPAFQNVLNAGNSSYVGSSPGAPGPNSNMRGVPDVAYNSSSHTGVLTYDSEEGGWFIVGGTSAASPQWAGLLALADAMSTHGDLGYINPALYQIFNGPNYHTDFYDVTNNCNQTNSTIPGWCASPGWDAVTGIGTPDAGKLIPDLIAATS